ncbi:MAG: hypothetical protein MUF25_12015 [Pirellulaceae bacterium]|jgi:hypothetical protein|nr:hypothetical protein [Pirellulaceae bacterium]
MKQHLTGIRRYVGQLHGKRSETKVRQQLFGETQRRYILQGFGSSDYQWVPEANGYFRDSLDLCVPIPVYTPPLPTAPGESP